MKKIKLRQRGFKRREVEVEVEAPKESIVEKVKKAIKK